MTAWFDALTLEQQIYYGIAIIATGLLALQLVLMMFGAGAEELVDAGDMDLDGPDEHPSGLQVLSSRTAVAFFVGFGWTGAIQAKAGASPAVSVFAALLVGLAFGWVILRLMRFLHTLKHSGTLNYDNALGQVGSVYLEVHPSLSSGGQIQVTFQGRLRVVPALTRSLRPIEKGSKVRVVERLDDNSLVVEPVSARLEA